MKKLFLILIVLMVLLVGCSELGYETIYEHDRRMCTRCADRCGMPPMDGSFGRFISDCTEDCYNELNITDCTDYCINQYNNRADIKNAQDCFEDECKMLC